MMKILFSDRDEFKEETWLFGYVIALYSFFCAYEEITQLETSLSCIKIITDLYELFSIHASVTWFCGRFSDHNVTIYGHLFRKIMPRNVLQFYELTGYGYVYCSMQV